MDLLIVLAAGIAIGLVVAAPIGAVNLICVRRTLEFGTVNGFIAGLGAAVGDGIFAAIAAFGLKAISSFILTNIILIKALGGLFLIGAGLYTWFSDPSIPSSGETGKRVVQDWTDDLPHTVGATLFLTLTNPATMLAFTAIFAGLGDFLTEKLGVVSAAVLVAAVAGGSALWWFLITLFVGRFHAQIDRPRLVLINHFSGALIGLFGLGVLLELLLG
jgi:threonine/homoserine/homoserine lactone efflux protein